MSITSGLLAAVQFVLRPETTSERKLVSKYARALRVFAEHGVTPETLPEAIRKMPGGISAAARQCSVRRKSDAPQLNTDPSALPPAPSIQPVPQGPARAADVSRVQVSGLERPRDTAQGDGWDLSLSRDLAAQLTTWRQKGVATLFHGWFRLRENSIELISARPTVMPPSNPRAMVLRSISSGRHLLGKQHPTDAAKHKPK